MPRPWADLRLRVLSAAVLAPVCLACVWLGGIPWILLMALGATGLALEWTHLCGASARSLPGLAVALVVLAAGALATRLPLPALAVLLAGAAALRWLSFVPYLPWGVPYVGLPVIALIWLRGGDDAGRGTVLVLVLVVCACDIGAYLAGRLLGGPKLAPAISPGKTWSGAAGGLLAAVLVGLAAARWQGGGSPFAGLLAPGLLAFGLGLVSQLGDLLESLLKRRFGVKDSGHLIPGHGGLLDRLDGLMAAAPAAALLAMVLGRGVLPWR